MRQGAMPSGVIGGRLLFFRAGVFRAGIAEYVPNACRLSLSKV
jgi:hypothetical protein